MRDGHDVQQYSQEEAVEVKAVYAVAVCLFVAAVRVKSDMV